MKTIFIGDIHGRPIWKDIVAKENADRVIFIGDYFDSFDIPGVDQIHNFKEIVEYKKTTIICGVYHEMNEEEKNNFINMMSENGKYDVVFDDGNTIPKLVEMSLPFTEQ